MVPLTDAWGGVLLCWDHALLELGLEGLQRRAGACVCVCAVPQSSCAREETVQVTINSGSWYKCSSCLGAACGSGLCWEECLFIDGNQFILYFVRHD